MPIMSFIISLAMFQELLNLMIFINFDMFNYLVLTKEHIQDSLIGKSTKYIYLS